MTRATIEGMMLKKIREHILDCAYYGHQEHCRAIHGPAHEEWYRDDECNCPRGEVLSFLNSLIEGTK